MKDSVIGIDVGKYELVIYWSSNFITIKNEEKALKCWLEENQAYLDEVKLFVYEPTGGYERNLQNVLEQKKLPYRRVHANHVRSYAKATGMDAKTDRIDAKILAEYGKRMELTARPLIPSEPALKALITRREQLLDMRLQENNRLETCQDILKKWINKNIKQLNKQILEVEESIKKYIKDNVQVKEKVELYTSIPGVGKITALQLIVDLAELATKSDKTLAALVGLAPWNRDSGTKIVRRKTRGGRTKIRGLLYMSALVATRCNPDLKKFYLKLKQKVKATKVALIAVAHKLLLILRSIAHRQTPWTTALSR
jgi:transposase